MDEGTQYAWAERAVRVVDVAFPNVEFPAWARCERLLSHTQACAELISQSSFEFPEGARLLNKAGVYLYERVIPTPSPFTCVRWRSGKRPWAGSTPRRGHQPQQPGGALQRPRPICKGRAPLRAGVGDPGKGHGTGAPPRGPDVSAAHDFRLRSVPVSVGPWDLPMKHVD
jgi:hypothetical protein